MKVVRPGCPTDDQAQPWDGVDVIHLDSSCLATIHVDEVDIRYKSTINGEQQRGSSYVVECGWCKREFALRPGVIPLHVSRRVGARS